MKFKVKDISPRSFTNFVFALLNDGGFWHFRAETNNDYLFSEYQLTHVQGFAEVWQKNLGKIKTIRFSYKAKDYSKQFKAIIDLQKNSFEISDLEGLSEEILKEYIKKYFQIIDKTQFLGFLSKKLNFFSLPLNPPMGFWGTVFASILSGIILIILGIFITNYLNNKNEDIKILKTSEESKVFEDNLRPLEPLETGKEVSLLPNYVYFFSNAGDLEAQIEYPNSSFVTASNIYLKNFSFEIQKIDSRYYIVGFVSDETYSRIGSTNSQNTLFTTLFPSRWDGAKKAISIPFDAVYTVEERRINFDSRTEVYALDIGFREANDRPTVHVK